MTTSDDLDQVQVPFPRSAADLDLDQLTEITARDGFAVYDPTAAGGFRELTDAERAVITPTPTGPEVEDTGRMSDAEYEAFVADAAASYRRDHLWSPADLVVSRVEEVQRRTDDPAFPYLPAAEWGDPGYREPRSDDEAAARVAYLDAQRETADRDQPAQRRENTEVEQALIDAEIDAHYSALAHDDDPAPARRVRELEALQELRPTPEHELELQAELDEPDHDQPAPQEQEQEHEWRGEDPGAAPALALEDAWFRSSLHDVVPADTPDRDAVIDRAVACARDRFVAHGEITYPEHALALAGTDQPEPDQPESDQELDEPAPELDEEPEL